MEWAPEIVDMQRQGATDLAACLLSDGAMALYEIRYCVQIPVSYVAYKDENNEIITQTMSVVEPFSWDKTTRKTVKTVIPYAGVPNHAMVPVNASAEKIFNAWERSVVGASGKLRSQMEAERKPYVFPPSDPKCAPAPLTVRQKISRFITQLRDAHRCGILYPEMAKSRTPGRHLAAFVGKFV